MTGMARLSRGVAAAYLGAWHGRMPQMAFSGFKHALLLSKSDCCRLYRRQRPTASRGHGSTAPDGLAADQLIMYV